MDGTSVEGARASGPVPVIVDSGTTLVYGDIFSVDAIYSAIPGAQDASFTLGEGFYTCAPS